MMARTRWFPVSVTLLSAVLCVCTAQYETKDLDKAVDTGGKQVYFEKSGDNWGTAGQVAYPFEVPASGLYGMTLRTATPNRDQTMKVAMDHADPVTVAVPDTHGLWGTTPELELQLEKGRHTLTLTHPRPGRGIALRWIELKLKGNR